MHIPEQSLGERNAPLVVDILQIEVLVL